MNSENFVLRSFLREKIYSKDVLEIFNYRTFIEKYGDKAIKICPICLNPCINPCKPGPCIHIFCSKCLGIWSNKKKVCPICRRKFTKIIKIK